MKNYVQTATRNEKGFTLVELAVVMIIVGLLIGGVLKGQEMIANAQVTATVAQSKAYNAAISTFRDQYQGLPGDISGTRLSNCGAVCAQVGNGNQQIGTEVGAAQATNATENVAAWAQLGAADLIVGVNQSSAVAGVPAAGIDLPAANIRGSSWQIGYANNVAMTGQLAAAIGRSGHYLLLDNSLAAAASAAAAPSLTPSQAARIDAKIDDGLPNTGSVLATGTGVGAALCTTAATAASVYNEALTGTLCGILIRVQG